MNNKENLSKKSNFYEDINNNVIGIDEVGRGIMGPVVSCSILLKKSILNQDLYVKLMIQKNSGRKRFDIAN